MFAFITDIKSYSAMSDENFVAWIFVVSTFGGMIFVAFKLGVYFTQGAFRVKSQKCEKRLKSYEKWGVTTVLFRPDSLKKYVICTVCLLLLTALMALLALLSTTLVIEDSLPGAGDVSYTVIIAAYGVLLGVLVESERIRKITDMTTSLDALRRVFHLRFRPTELLSIYESLRFAPPKFWEEYSRLPAHEINPDTNHRYRQSASVYSNIQFGQYHRITIVVGVLTVFLAVASAAIQLFLKA